MAEIENSIAQCCKQLRLSTNFAGQALTLEGDTPQKYLLNLLENEIILKKEKVNILIQPVFHADTGQKNSKQMKLIFLMVSVFKACLTWIFIMPEKMSSCMEVQEPAKRCCQY